MITGSYGYCGVKTRDDTDWALSATTAPSKRLPVSDFSLRSSQRMNDLALPDAQPSGVSETPAADLPAVAKEAEE
jgi:hypothetical protein